jgi:hypothetical protein
MNKQISALSISLSSKYDELVMSLINSLSNMDSFLDIKLFTTSCDIVVPNKKYSILPIFEGKYSKNPMIVWDLLSLELALQFPNIPSIIYIQDKNIPWIKNREVPYSVWNNFFNNDKVKIVSSHPMVAEVFEMTWKKTILLTPIKTESFYEIL